MGALHPKGDTGRGPGDGPQLGLHPADRGVGAERDPKPGYIHRHKQEVQRLYYQAVL